MEDDSQDILCTFDTEHLRRKENVKCLLGIGDASEDAKDVVLLADGRGGCCRLLPREAKGSKLLCIQRHSRRHFSSRGLF